MTKTLAEMSYKRQNVMKGYTDKTLHIDLSKLSIEENDVDKKVREIFIGGKGYDLWLMWESLPKNRIVKWNEPENPLCIASGPLGGTAGYPGAGKSIVTAISPLTDIVIDSNVGGFFGPWMKYSGFDALRIVGKAKEPVVIVIDGTQEKVWIEPAGDLPTESHLLAEQLNEKYRTIDKETGKDDRLYVSVVSAGPGADHSYFGCLNFSWWDNRRKANHLKQAGRGGTGTIFRNKNIVAIVAHSPSVNLESQHPEDQEAAKLVGRKHSKEILTLDDSQNKMRVIGTAHLPSIMSEFDLLPTYNFKYGRDDDGKDKTLWGDAYEKIFSNTGKGWDGCWRGCAINCAHCVEDYKLETGPYKGQKVLVDGPEYETIAGVGSNLGIFDPLHVVEINFYCDTYGLDTISFGTALGFVMECYETGILDKEKTNGLDLKFGNFEATMEIMHRIALGKDEFALIFARGIRKMKEYFKVNYNLTPEQEKFCQDIGMEHKGLEYSEYITKESLAQQGGYGLTLKGPQHDEAWLIFLDMVHNYMPTFENKAEALCWFPYWRTWFSLNGLCKLPWNDVVPEDNKDSDAPHKVPDHVQNYATLFESITGVPMGKTPQEREDSLVHISQRVYQFQRVFQVRLGHGRRIDDSNVPYRSVGPVTLEEYESRMERYDKQLVEILGKTLEEVQKMPIEERHGITRKHREEQYDKLQDAVYEKRGWNHKSGVIKLDVAKKLWPEWLFDEVLPFIKDLQD
ncbi:MAG: aldehyde:ferredoxin oxidoreductase [Candidatus Heimdallarchaeota archaeon]|nr:aldehyde:ferredoxin oxidoreductase [Candidatus Heimdallarchaeota archaeon]MCK4289863.1 aldehyde:ferredoxin oxidoreductase [Candidatus Heimdallarchaeota archaeon]